MEQVLKLFVEKKSTIEWTNKIHTGDGWIAATDGYAIGCLFKDLKSENSEAFETLQKFIRRIQIDKSAPLTISIGKINGALDKCDRDEEFEGVKCDACKGAGFIHFDFYYNHKSYELQSDCPVCYGIGEIESKPTGKFYYSEDKSIQIGETYILPTQIDRLVKAAEMLGEKEVTIYQSNQHDKKGHVFVIGALEGIVMPCTNTENTIKL